MARDHEQYNQTEIRKKPKKTLAEKRQEKREKKANR